LPAPQPQQDWRDASGEQESWTYCEQAQLVPRGQPAGLWSG